MTTDYIERNAQGYEGDYFIGVEIKKLVERFKIEKIIETGTYLGATTKKLAEFCPTYSVEINNEFYKRALENIKDAKGHEIFLIEGNSINVLPILFKISKTDNLLFFLDAHWYNFCPLLDELRLIAENKLKPVIVIHDWKVPNRPDLGFDSHDGIDFEWKLIEKSIEAIYGISNYSYHYNSQATGAKRGVIYIYPKDLSCMS
jgi:hypothetical protein